MRKLIVALAAALLLACSVNAQKIAVKNNLLYDATSTPNISAEISLSRKATLDLGYGYHPWKNAGWNDADWRHWLLQPELRWWTCEAFNGLFLGLHAHGGEYNISGIDVPFILQNHEGMKDNRYEGWFYGGGVSIGYHWMLSRRVNIEASVGGGYARTEYDKYDCGECGRLRGSGTADYLGITKATLSLVWLIAL